MTRVIDCFSGIGWGLGLRTLGIDEVGIDWEPAVCATRARLGLATIRADLATFPPRGTYDGLIASPPCTDFSQAGNRAGRAGKTGRLIDVVPRWVEAIGPTWVACEQVPQCLPIWEEHAAAYRALGYKTWTGVLCAADWGVPQTRRRAFLLAHRHRQPYPPAPTHSREGDGLFGERPWVSMAEALGWADGTEMHGVRSEKTGDRPGRRSDEPAFTVAAGKARTGPRFVVLAERQSKGTRRWIGQPAMTITASADNGNFRWLNTGRDWKPGGTREDAQCIPIDEPAPTVGSVNSQWQWRRPATTVCGDPRVWAPGHKENSADPPGRYQQRRGEQATKVSIAEGLVLQGFDPDTPLVGTKTQQWAIIGNAVAPPWAAAIVGALL